MHLPLPIDGRTPVVLRGTSLTVNVDTVSWGHRELEAIAGDWDALLAQSDADPLFNSPQWLIAWWRQYQSQLSAKLEILASIETGRLVGLALVHGRQVSHRFGLTGTRYELLGTAWRVKGVGFSEKTSLILARGSESVASEGLVDALLDDPSWDDFIVSHTPRDEPTHQAVMEMARRCGGYLRVPDAMEAWEIPLGQGFEGFLGGLGQGTRARVMSSRKRLAAAGGFEERVLGHDELDTGWEIFSGLHQARWNRPFSMHWRNFYGAIADEQANAGVPVISILEFKGQPVSALVNFRAGQREYSIASAFVPVDVKRVSLGWMHLGLAIERACADGMTHFDLLGGEGKQEQYKASLGGICSELICLQLIRNPVLAMTYRAWDAFQAGRSRVRRLIRPG